MSSSLAITPTQPNASQALLRERLAQLESVLLEARGRVMLSFDRELASLRGWMDSLEHFDPTVGLQALDHPTPTVGDSVQELISEPPHTAASNIVPFSTQFFPDNSAGLFQEQPLDPVLASATLDELNAALTAAFQQMSQKAPLSSTPRSA